MDMSQQNLKNKKKTVCSKKDKKLRQIILDKRFNELMKKIDSIIVTLKNNA